MNNFEINKILKQRQEIISKNIDWYRKEIEELNTKIKSLNLENAALQKVIVMLHYKQ